MVRFVTVASASVCLCVTGCADLLSPNGYLDVQVIADLRSDNTVTYTVQNDSPNAIVLDLSPAVQMLQYRENGEWRWPDPQPTIMPLWLARIEAGDTYVSDPWDTSEWRPREYRFVLNLNEDISVSDYPEGAKLLPEEVRVSDSFRVE